jgi:hypothetical protein
MQPQNSISRAVVAIITNLTKVLGLVVAVNEAILRSDLRPQVLAVAAFMMAGAQGFEQLVGAMFGGAKKESEE